MFMLWGIDSAPMSYLRKYPIIRHVPALLSLLYKQRLRFDRIFTIDSLRGVEEPHALS
jgi:hypothetical protein